MLFAESKTKFQSLRCVHGYLTLHYKSDIVFFYFYFFSFCRRDTLESEDVLSLASFIGEQLRHLHLLSTPPQISIFSDAELEEGFQYNNDHKGAFPEKSDIPAEWDIFIRTLNRQKKDVISRLKKWYVCSQSLKLSFYFFFIDEPRLILIVGNLIGKYNFHFLERWISMREFIKEIIFLVF